MTQSNYPVLLEAGARIYEFTPGFIHSKTVVADDLYASVGSCNLDYRSFYLQFENGVWLCGDPAVLSVRDDFLQTLEVCQEITLADCRTPSPVPPAAPIHLPAVRAAVLMAQYRNRLAEHCSVRRFFSFSTGFCPGFLL